MAEIKGQFIVVGESAFYRYDIRALHIVREEPASGVHSIKDEWRIVIQYQYSETHTMVPLNPKPREWVDKEFCQVLALLDTPVVALGD